MDINQAVYILSHIDYQKLGNPQQRSLEYTIEWIKQVRDTVKRRNMQIKDLRAKLLEHNHFVCSHCPEIASGNKDFGCLTCKYSINR